MVSSKRHILTRDDGILQAYYKLQVILLRPERMAADCLRYDGWVRFRPLYRGRCLGDLITRYVGHSGSVEKAGEGADQMNVEGTPEGLPVKCYEADVASLMTSA